MNCDLLNWCSMRNKFSVLVLSAFFVALYLSQTIVAQITFAETPIRQRPQSQGQTGGLSQEKKKSLSKYGPEDAFPGAREQDSNSTPSKRNNSRSSQRIAASPTPLPSPTLNPSPAAVTPTPVTPSPSPTSPVGSAKPLNQTQPNNTESSILVPAALLTAALLVLGALIYVLGMLRKKLKQDG